MFLLLRRSWRKCRISIEVGLVESHKEADRVLLIAYETYIRCEEVVIHFVPPFETRKDMIYLRGMKRDDFVPPIPGLGNLVVFIETYFSTHLP